MYNWNVSEAASGGQKASVDDGCTISTGTAPVPAAVEGQCQRFKASDRHVS